MIIPFLFLPPISNFHNFKLCLFLKSGDQAFFFFEKEVEKISPETKIVLVENYLSEKIGDAEKQEFYEEVDHIRKMNEILRGYYDFAASRSTKIIRVPAYQAPLYFTDKEYEYGAVPSHLNEVVNKTIAKMIAEIIFG